MEPTKLDAEGRGLCSELVDRAFQLLKLRIHLSGLDGLQLGNRAIGRRQLDGIGASFQPLFEGSQFVIDIATLQGIELGLEIRAGELSSGLAAGLKAEHLLLHLCDGGQGVVGKGCQ